VSDSLTRDQLRVAADYLYDGSPKVAHLMAQLRAFKQGDRIILWLCQQGIRGQYMVDFFKEESGCDENRGVLLGVQKALDYIEGRKFHTERLDLGALK